jgi:enterochelin esterase-like enzyme
MRPVIRGLLISLFFLAGCHSFSPASVEQATPTPFNCTLPGKVEALTVVSFGEIGVFLPPCYDSTSSTLYPVLYLLPGFVGTYREWLDTGIASLTDDHIQRNEIPPFLIVTTGNTYEIIKPDDIVLVLIPYIETLYRASPERIHRAIAGGSLGGATAYVLTFQHPDLFSSAGVFGNGLTTGQEEQDENWRKAIPAGLKHRLFLNSGEQDN